MNLQHDDVSDLPPHRLDLVIAQVEDRLDRLPDRPDDIADYLHQVGITGTPHSSDDCPLRNYLIDNLPAGFQVIVDQPQVQIRDSDPPARNRHTIALLPHLTTFTRRFDNGEYPALRADTRR